MNIGAVILSGGKSSRMGVDKAGLIYNGDSFLERVRKALSGFDELMLSVGDAERYKDCGIPVVSDIYVDRGPIGGLHAALTACRSDALFTATCDMPLFDFTLVEYLCSKADGDYDAVVAVTRDGYVHPLCAVYKKSAAAVLENQIRQGDNRVKKALEHMKVCYAPIAEAGIPDSALLNVNTPEEYERLMKTTKERG